MSDAVLMPVYNEAETVGAVLDAVRVHYDGEILVVNDGSTDSTNAVLAARNDVTIIAHPTNLGYGRALAEGFAVARSREVARVITMDCDGQHEPKHIPEFLTALNRGFDIVSGSRYLPGSRAVGDAPAGRKEVNERITAMINAETGWSLTDAFCGFKAYRLAALDVFELHEPGYGMPVELWAKAYLAGLAIEETPVERIYYDHDRSFGADLDDDDTRYAYYISVWERAMGRGEDG